MTSKSGPKKRGNPRMKEAWAARALMEKFGFDNPEDMEAALSRLKDVPSDLPVDTGVETTAVLSDEPVAMEIATSDNIDVSVGVDLREMTAPDPLQWVDEDVQEVYVVRKCLNLFLRSARDGVQPPLDAIQITRFREGAWESNPFDLRSRNNERERYYRTRWGNWAHFCITRSTAEAVYGDERYPIPEKVVVSPAEFRGWDSVAQRSRGKKQELVNPDPLREALRYTLQRLANSCFINWGMHSDVLLRWNDVKSIPPRINVDPKIANPYGNTLQGMLTVYTPPREGAFID